MTPLLLAMSFTAFSLYWFLIEPLFVTPLSKIPGPKSYALTKWRLAYDDWTGNRTRCINRLHQRYGPVVRIGPNEVHFNSVSALRTIYGAGSGYERTKFYDMFDVYDTKMLFTFYSTKLHADRKKLLANAYSKSNMLKPASADIVVEKVRQYLEYIDLELNGKPNEIFTSLHYFSVDTIAHFVYGKTFGATSALAGNNAHRHLLDDVLDPSRRKLSWFAVHLESLTNWLYSRQGLIEQCVRPMLPMQEPVTYTGIRQHAWEAWEMYKSAITSKDREDEPNQESSIMSLLFRHHISQRKDGNGLEDLDLASECADHLLAGIDTTADTLAFVIWVLSLPENREYQQKLIEEIRALPAAVFDETGVPSVEAADKPQYLNAVIKETLRLYAPLPATEPRSLPTDSVIDDYPIPARTIVGMSPYSLHRNEQVFENHTVFNPDRWISEDTAQLTEMNRWFWAFSSGGRMCIGLHLAMAEMTTLTAAIYRRYTTTIASGFEGFSPAISSRFELFFEENMPHVKEHECWINFTRNDV